MSQQRKNVFSSADATWCVVQSWLTFNRRTAAVTGPPPANYDLKSRVIGGSRSPHGYARHGRDCDGVQVPSTRLGISRSSVYQMTTPIEKVLDLNQAIVD